MDIILTHRGVAKKSGSLYISINTGKTVYEVIRIIDGIPLFLREHFDRLVNSVQIQNWKLSMGFDEFKVQVYQLIKLNQKEIGNIKFEFLRSGGENRWVFSFIPFSYPTPEDYQTGIPTDLLFEERENPGAKVIQHIIREKSNEMISSRQLYEILLVNRDGKITEGSRSNVFFVKNEIFYTAPSTMVLVGITRQKVLECLRKLNYSMVEEAISFDTITRFDAAFLTGTSPKVLPIQSIGNHQFSTKLQAVQKLIEKYDEMIEDYIIKNPGN